MCGICGIVNFISNPAPFEMVRRMNSALRHRGPDDEGYYFTKTLHWDIAD